MPHQRNYTTDLYILCALDDGLLRAFSILEALRDLPSLM